MEGVDVRKRRRDEHEDGLRGRDSLAQEERTEVFGDLVVFCEAAEVAEWLGGVAGEAGVQDSVVLETEVSCEGVRCVWE